MNRREYTPGQSGGGISSFQAVAQPAPPAVRPVDYTGIRQAFDSWTAQAQAEQEAIALEQVASRAMEAQQTLGTAEVAEPDREMARRYNIQFKEAAEAVYLQQLSVDALKMDTELRQQYQFDPDGYANAWGEFAANSIDSLRKENVRLYSRGKEILDNQGTRSWATISNAAFERAEIEQKAASLRNVQETVNIFGDRMRDPSIDNEQRTIEFNEGITTVTVGLMSLLDTNQINGAEFETLRQQAEDNLRTEWVTTNFNDVMSRGDVGSARGYINSLRQGEWFVDNTKADALAARLEASIPDTTAQMRKQYERAAKAEASMLALGVAPSPDLAGAVNRYIEFTARFDPESLPDALSVEAGLYARQVVRNIESMGVDALIAARTFLAADVNMPSGDRTAMVGAIDDRLAQFETAIRTNDTQAIRNLMPFASVEELAISWNVDPESLPVASTQQVSEAWQLAKNSGMGMQTLTPLIEEAVLRGATAADLIHTALRSDLDTGEVAAFAMASVAASSGLSHLAERAIMDADFTATDPTLEGIDFVNRMDDRDAHRVIAALSMGDPDLRTSLRTALNNMFRAEVARYEGQGGQSSAAQRQAAKKIIQELKQMPLATVGGRSYPLAMFGTDDRPNQQKETIRQLNDRVNASEREIGQVHNIVADGTGGFNIVAGNNMVVDYWRPEEVTEQNDRIRIQQAELRDDVRAAKVDWINAYVEDAPFLQSQRQQEQFGRSIVNASRKHNVPFNLAQRFAIAIIQSPDEERAGRSGQLAVPQDALYTSAQGAAWRPRELTQLDPATNNKAFEIFSELRDKYKDNDKALAAYWVGENVVDEYVALYGDDWLAEISPKAREFVYRAQTIEDDSLGGLPVGRLGTIYPPSPTITLEALEGYREMYRQGEGN